MWRVVYRTRGGHQVVATTLTRPPRYRTFRVAGKGGKKKFRAVKVQQLTKEVIFVAKTKSKNTKKKGKEKDEVLTDDDLEELEELEDLDEDEDEDEDVDTDDSDDEDDEDSEDEDEDDEDDDSDEDDEEEPDEEDEDEDDEDDDEDEDDEPKSKKKSSKKSKSKKSKKKDDGKIGSQEVAEHLGISGRQLRIILRRNPDIQEQVQDPESKQYRFSSLKHPAIKKLEKLVKSGEHKKAAKESFDKMKSKKTGKKKSSTKGKKKSKK